MLENKNNTEEDRVAIVEQQLAQAKLIAEEAVKKYEEVKSLLEQTKIPLLTSILILQSTTLYSNYYIQYLKYIKVLRDFISRKKLGWEKFREAPQLVTPLDHIQQNVIQIGNE